MEPHTPPVFLPLTGIYEPSAVQQLPDGRFLVVEDEKQHPFSLLTIPASGDVSSTSLSAGLLQMFNSFWKLDDLEALALDRSGYLYALTSHSRDDNGDEKKSREKLARFRVQGKRVVGPIVVDGLKQAVVAIHPALAQAANIRDVKTGGGLNIEALEISPDQQRLLVGFRSPLLDTLAIVASVENPAGMFDSGQAPRIAARLETLDLRGHGIRAMCYVAALEGYLVVGGPVSREKGQFALWFWSGLRAAPARRVTVPGLQGFEHAEGVSPAVIGGLQRLLIVSDDGNRKEKRCAHYLVLDPAQLQIMP